MVISEKVYEDFKHGEIDSFYKECYISLMAYSARTLTDNYSLMAEDCVQDTILAAYNRRDSFDSLMQFKSFLFTCLHNKCISIIRKGNSRENYVKEQPLSEDSILASIVEQETIDLLQEAIDQLPDMYKEVFLISYKQGLNNAETAEALGLTLDGMKKRKARLIKLLREKLKDRPDLQLLIILLLS